MRRFLRELISAIRRKNRLNTELSGAEGGMR
jgi:hypothetical protein